MFATLGPERPQPDMSPRAGIDDAGDLTNALNGNDKPYGTGYASLVSRELCMTTPMIREGAEVRGRGGDGVWNSRQTHARHREYKDSGAEKS